MDNLGVKISTLAVAIEELKPEFETYIKDETHPLTDRWALFTTAPDCLSNHSQFIVKFPEQAADFRHRLFENRNRGDFTAEDVVCCLYEDAIGQLMETGLDRDKDAEAFQHSKLEKLEPLINIMKQFFLEKNLKSFLYDW